MAGEDNNGTQWNYYIGPSESAARRSWQPLAPMPPTTGRNHRCRICTRSFDRPSSLVQVSGIVSSGLPLDIQSLCVCKYSTCSPILEKDVRKVLLQIPWLFSPTCCAPSSQLICAPIAALNDSLRRATSTVI